MILSAMLAMAVLSSPVLAGGGGGTKKDATIKITHDLSSSAGAVAFVINASSAFKSKVSAGTVTMSDLNAAGGKVLQPGQSASFKVKSGSNRIGYASVDSDGEISSFGEVSRSVGKGKTLEILASALLGSSS